MKPTDTDLLTLAVEVDEGVAGRRDVLRRRALVHAVDVQVETTVGVHQQTQHRPLWTGVQIRTIVLTYLRKRGIGKKVKWGEMTGKGEEEKSETKMRNDQSNSQWGLTPMCQTLCVCLPLGSCGRRSLSAAARRSVSDSMLWRGSWAGRGSDLSPLTTATTSTRGSGGRSETGDQREAVDRLSSYLVYILIVN